MDQAWVYNRHFVLYLNDFSVARCLRAQLLLGSAALVLRSVLGSAGKVRTFGFGSQGSAGGGGVIVWWWHKDIGCCMHESAGSIREEKKHLECSIRQVTR